MAQGNPVSVSQKRTRLQPVLLGIAVVAILVLSATLVAYYEKAKDCHDAEYRAQHYLAQVMSYSIHTTAGSVSIMMNDSLSLPIRYDSGRIAVTSFDRLSISCEMVKNMYPSESEVYSTFENLRHASSLTMCVCDDTLDDMWQNITADELYVHDEAVALAFFNASYLFLEIVSCINQGIDSRVDWREDPYPIVNGMDLAGIDTRATLIITEVSVNEALA